MAIVEGFQDIPGPDLRGYDIWTIPEGRVRWCDRIVLDSGRRDPVADEW